MQHSRNIELKTAAEIAKMRSAGEVLRNVMLEVGKAVRPGATTGELDSVAYELINAAGAIPAFLGYHGYPATLCISINEQVVHGIPGDRVLKPGDLVSIDNGLVLDGFYADMASTYPVGDITPEQQKLLDVTSRALDVGIEQMRPGTRLGTISAAIQQYVESNGFSVVRDYTGHGIGRAMHEPPQVPNFGTRDTGVRLKAGMVIALEPMVNIGTWKTRTLKDGWTVVTADGAPSAHFEHTVAVTDGGPQILTI